MGWVGGCVCKKKSRDCIISHGASQFLLERLFEQSDAYSTVVCTACGLLAVPAKPQNGPIMGMAVRGYDAPYCRVCETGAHVREVKMPYACKLLVQELMALCIAFRFRFDPPAHARGEPTTRPLPDLVGDDHHHHHYGGVDHAMSTARQSAYADHSTAAADVMQIDGERTPHSGGGGEEPAAVRIEGMGKDDSVLMTVPPMALDGILHRVEATLRATEPQSKGAIGKRKR